VNVDIGDGEDATGAEIEDDVAAGLVREVAARGQTQ